MSSIHCNGSLLLPWAERQSARMSKITMTAVWHRIPLHASPPSLLTPSDDEPPSFWHTPTLLVKCFKSRSVRPSLVDCVHYTLVRLLSRFGTVPWKQRQNVTRSSPLQRCTAYWKTSSNYRIRSAVPQNPTVESNSKSIRPPVLQRYHHFQDGRSLKVTWCQTRTNIKKSFRITMSFDCMYTLRREIEFGMGYFRNFLTSVTWSWPWPWIGSMVILHNVV